MGGPTRRIIVDITCFIGHMIFGFCHFSRIGEGEKETRTVICNERKIFLSIFLFFFSMMKLKNSVKSIKKGVGIVNRVFALRFRPPLLTVFIHSGADIRNFAF